ncbi:unnamed protein product [Paramecium sonneborni]|uniref:Uncharacterized protein n=1 Tax=Paramecium sonneborni TaxID=65129 RepID=A0A8S1NHH1_9CILI|nr:unnamed protein product [Paramecium sonneborni]
MISDQLRQVLSNNTPNIIGPQLSRKTVLLKRKNKKICNNTLNQLPQKGNQDVSSKGENSQKTDKTDKTDTNTQKSHSNMASQTLNQIPCISQDVFDGIEIPATDPIWLEIIPQELLLETSVEKLLEDNKDYFYNLLGLYLQERAIGDLNMSRFVLPQKFQTQYSKDFTLKSIDRKIGIDSRIYEDYKQNSSQNQNTTTYKQYFQKPIPNEIIQSFKPISERRILAMAALTTYKANHINFKQPEKPEIMKAPTNSTTGRLQLNGNSNYNQDYKWHQNQNYERLPNFKNSYSKLNPISNSDIFFTKERASIDFYPLSPLQKATQIITTPSFQGQFTTTFKHDYQQVDQELLTPKTRNWKLNVINKINSVRERQIQQ